MKIKILLILNFVFIPFVYAETVYKTLDGEGNIIFSDVPSEGAEVIKLQKAQTIKLPEAKPHEYESLKKESSENEYNRLVIINPENNATIRSNEGKISIDVEVKPELFEGDLFVLFMDGKEMSSGTSLQFALSNLDRGMHTVDVGVKNEKGIFLKRSAKLIFHLRKESLLFQKTTSNAKGTENTGLIPFLKDLLSF